VGPRHERGRSGRLDPPADSSAARLAPGVFSEVVPLALADDLGRKRCAGGRFWIIAWPRRGSGGRCERPTHPRRGVTARLSAFFTDVADRVGEPRHLGVDFGRVAGGPSTVAEPSPVAGRPSIWCRFCRVRSTHQSATPTHWTMTGVPVSFDRHRTSMSRLLWQKSLNLPSGRIPGAHWLGRRPKRSLEGAGRTRREQLANVVNRYAGIPQRVLSAVHRTMEDAAPERGKGHSAIT